MKSIGTAINALCCSLVTAALIKMLLPTGSCEKILRFVLSLFMIICIVSCFITVAGQTDALHSDEFFSLEDAEKVQNNVNEKVLKVTGDYMAEYIDALFNAEGISVTNIEVTVKTDEESVINVTDIRIYIDKSELAEKNKITEIIEEEFKIAPQITVKESL